MHTSSTTARGQHALVLVALLCRPASSNKYAACSFLLRGGCSDASKPYCNTLAMYNALCAFDNPPDAPCKAYTDYCAAAGNEGKCAEPANKAWPQWVNSTMFQHQVFRMCNVHNMEGCDRCAKPAMLPTTPLAQLDPCDSLATYVIMCKAMPDMTACGFPWKPMCRNLAKSNEVFPNICAASALTDDNGDDGTGLGSSHGNHGAGSGSGSGTGDNPFEFEIPPMRMYFHQDINDLLLFRAWVTRTHFQYWMATIGVFVASFGFSAWVWTIRRVWIPKLNVKLAAVNLHIEGTIGYADARAHLPASQTTLPLNTADAGVAGVGAGSRTSLIVKREALIAARAALLVVELAWSYTLMLIAMAFNLGWIAAFLLGAFAGNMVFNRDAPAPPKQQMGVGQVGEDSARVSEDGKDGMMRQATCC
ncbi:Ctr copper transporter family-domain-containing protein [Catenaria anguillulae PL171]|uniref:Copper transport protein n=1 Tax=Catenaria anguillulae PL171 TaxID=765915 RepID=A0A1Y2HG56_9FUNG|nr:Ctr copper transporter family-domain-containing protein [Catenaria anguillulae PL171]